MGKQARMRAERRLQHSANQARINWFARLYSVAAPGVIYSEFDEKCCPNATRVLIDVAKSYDIVVDPMVVRAIVMNAKQLELLKLHGGFPKDPDQVQKWWEAGSYSVMVDATPDDNPGPEQDGFSGHIVGLAGNLLIDSSARQLSRPAWAMEYPDVAVVICPGDFRNGGSLTATLPSGTTVNYRAHPDVKRYTQLTGFSRHPGNMVVAAKVRKAMDKVSETEMWEGSPPKVP